MIREISAMDARKNLGELLNEVKYLRDKIVIKKAGKPIAALIDVDLFDKLMKYQSQLEELSAEIEKSSHKEHAQAADEIKITEESQKPDV